MDELGEFDWEPEHRSGRREQVIQVLAGLLMAYSQKGTRLMMGDDRISVNHCHWERALPKGSGSRSQSQFGRSQIVQDPTEHLINIDICGLKEGGPDFDYK